MLFHSLFRSDGKRPILSGIFRAAVSVVCWGTLFPVVSYLLKRGTVDSYTMAQARFLIAGGTMLLYGAFKSRKMPWTEIKKKDWIGLITQSVFASAMSVLLFCGQERGLPVVNASMLEAESPLLIFVLGILILHAKTSFLQTLGLILGFAGSMLVLKAVSSEGIMLKSMSTGDFLIFLGATCWALYTVLSRRTIRRIGGLRYTSWSLLFAGVWILLFQLFAGMHINYPQGWADWSCTAYVGLIPTALAFFAWNNAQRYIATGLLAVSGYFTPMLTALFGWLMLGECVTILQMAGMVLVVGSALIEPDIADLIRSMYAEKREKRKAVN